MDLVKLKQSIKKNEGLELKPYLCTKGKLTIGYGRNLEQNGITEREAEILLENDLLNLKLELEDKLPIFKKLNNVRRNVLLEMAFQLGTPNLLKFKKTFEYLKNDDYEKASEEMLNSKWHEELKAYDMQNGKKSNEPLRSEYLANLMKKGEF